MDLQTLLPTGKFVLAVSGGVDSVVLLDVVAKAQADRPKTDFVVAHFDHGIRQDSPLDAELVRCLADKYDFLFELGRASLGPAASEAEARDRRYKFLRQIMAKHGADFIVTAHHQDDVIATSILNILRGTGRHGLSSLKNRPDIIRPFLAIPKADLKEYANQQGLEWHEDSTNSNPKYLRNYVRLNIVDKMTKEDRAKWLNILSSADRTNNQLDIAINQLLQRGLHKDQLVLSRKWFIMLPHALAKEVLLAILEKAGTQDIDKKTIERLTIQIKTVPAGKTLQTVGTDVYLTKRSARFKRR